jgi:DMSO/TMAO reductase YedYZ heme-binding membrane subunit
MNEHAAWYLARAGGLVAWAMVILSVIWGLLLSTKLFGSRPKPSWVLDLHRFFGGAAVSFTALHIVGLVADNYVHFGAADLFVPFVSEWRPLPVALGIVALYLLAAVEVTSLMMRRLPRKLWRWIHLTSYLLFFAVAIHGASAGTDSGNPIYVWGSNLAIAVVLFLTIVRVVSSGRTRRSPTRSGQAATQPVEAAVRS